MSFQWAEWSAKGHARFEAGSQETILPHLFNLRMKGMTMHVNVLSAAFAACLAAHAAAIARSYATPARSSAPSTNLPPIIVEASRLGKTTLEMPQFVETVTRDEIALSGARDTTDLLERETGVFIRRLGGENPALAQVAMRGYGENSFGRVLVAVDGEVLNNPDMSPPTSRAFPSMRSSAWKSSMAPKPCCTATTPPPAW